MAAWFFRRVWVGTVAQSDKLTPLGRISIAGGRLDPDLPTVCTILRDEMFFLPAFLEHYRQIGVRQFFILDDGSTDGTAAYLAAQPDCVIARSAHRYGDRIGKKRAVHVWKSEMPGSFLPGRWVLTLDADEFLFLPPEHRTVGDLTGALDRAGATAAQGVLVDFYPENLDRMRAAGSPAGADELFASYPYFDAGPYLEWSGGRGDWVRRYCGVRGRMLRRYGVSRKEMGFSGPRRLLYRATALVRGKSYNRFVGKVPLVKWTEGSAYLNSHRLNREVGGDVLLPMAHFKFTSDLDRKIGDAVESGSYTEGSREYVEYRELLRAMEADGGCFLGPESRRFTGTPDLERAGLLACSL